MSALLDLPLDPRVADLLARADKWDYCGLCRYVARTINVENVPCPECGEQWWMSVGGLDRKSRWAFVLSEIPNAVVDALGGEPA